MKKSIYILAFGILGLASCKKTEDNNSRERLTGTWNVYHAELSQDGSSNFSTMPEYENVRFRYLPGGEGEYLAVNAVNSQSFTWYLSADFKKITITYKGIGGSKSFDFEFTGSDKLSMETVVYLSPEHPSSTQRFHLEKIN